MGPVPRPELVAPFRRHIPPELCHGPAQKFSSQLCLAGIYVDALVIKFEDIFVTAGDALKGKALLRKKRTLPPISRLSSTASP